MPPPPRATNASHVTFSKSTNNSSINSSSPCVGADPNYMKLDNKLVSATKRPAFVLFCNIIEEFMELSQNIRGNSIAEDQINKNPACKKSLLGIKKLLSDLDKEKINEPFWDNEDEQILSNLKLRVSNSNNIYKWAMSLDQNDEQFLELLAKCALATQYSDKFLTKEIMISDPEFKKLRSKICQLISNIEKGKINDPTWDDEAEQEFAGMKEIWTSDDKLYKHISQFRSKPIVVKQTNKIPETNITNKVEKIMPENILPDNLDADDNLNADDFFDYWSKSDFETFNDPVKKLCFEISKNFKVLAQHIKDKSLTVEAMGKDATFNKLASKLKNLMSDLKKKKTNQPSWDKEDDDMLFGWEYVLSHKNVLYGKVLAILAGDYWKCKPKGYSSIKTQIPKPQIKNTQSRIQYNLTNSSFTLQPLPGGGYNVVPNYETVPIIKSSSHSQSRSNEHTERISEENINKYYDLKKRELEDKLGAEGRDSSIGMWQMSDLENKRRRALINAELSSNKTNTDDVINNHYDQAKREIERTVDPNSAEGIRQIALLENERRKAMMDANFSQITKGKSWLY